MLKYALPFALAAVPFAAHAAGAPDDTVLSISAEGHSTRTPDVASFSTGVASTGKTAAAAMAANAANMNRVIAALKAAGIADRDIQTSTLSLSPTYAERSQVVLNGQPQNLPPRITGYTANNTVAIRQRKLAEVGRVIDALVVAGANEISGPDFAVDQPDARRSPHQCEEGRPRPRRNLCRCRRNACRQDHLDQRGRRLYAPAQADDGPGRHGRYGRAHSGCSGRSFLVGQCFRSVQAGSLIMGATARA